MLSLTRFAFCVIALAAKPPDMLQFILSDSGANICKTERGLDTLLGFLSSDRKILDVASVGRAKMNRSIK